MNSNTSNTSNTPISTNTNKTMSEAPSNPPSNLPSNPSSNPSTSISAAAHQYQLAMSHQQLHEPGVGELQSTSGLQMAAIEGTADSIAIAAVSTLHGDGDVDMDVVMGDGMGDGLGNGHGNGLGDIGEVGLMRGHSPTQGASTAASPAPQRTGTPVRGRDTVTEATSRAPSLLPDAASLMPADAPPHGAPTRQYLNGKVTGVLLEGMKVLAKDQPRDPLRVLGEYLIQRSKDLDGM